MEQAIQEIFDSIIGGEKDETVEKIKAAIQSGLPIETIVNGGMIGAMSEVGRRFEQGEYFVPEMLVAARAMQHGMAVVKPYLATSGIKAAGVVCIGTVKGDLHDIGKNLVSVMLEGAGFTIKDLGTDVSTEKFVEAVRTHQPDILAMSALLTTTMPNFTPVIEALKQAGLRDTVKVLVGGAPVTTEFARDVGADAYAPDASRAVGAAKQLVSH
jgi:5-methyltetrahydrofolate--homocysteine methyltransferase